MFKIFGPNKRNCSSSVIYRQKVFNSKIHVKSYNCDYRHTWKVVPGIRDVYRWNPRTRDQGPKMYRWDTWLGTPKVRSGTRDSKINSKLCWWMRFEDFLIQLTFTCSKLAIENYNRFCDTCWIIREGNSGKRVENMYIKY